MTAVYVKFQFDAFEVTKSQALKNQHNRCYLQT